MKKDTFLRSVLRIALPVALQAMLQSSFSMIDQIMVGQLGSDGVAAIEVASRPAFIYITMIGALAAIAGIMVSQYMGQKDYKAGDRSLSVGLVGAGALATALRERIAPPLLTLERAISASLPGPIFPWVFPPFWR